MICAPFLLRAEGMSMTTESSAALRLARCLSAAVVALFIWLNPDSQRGSYKIASRSIGGVRTGGTSGTWVTGG